MAKISFFFKGMAGAFPLLLIQSMLLFYFRLFSSLLSLPLLYSRPPRRTLLYLVLCDGGDGGRKTVGKEKCFLFQEFPAPRDEWTRRNTEESIDSTDKALVSYLCSHKKKKKKKRNGGQSTI